MSKQKQLNTEAENELIQYAKAGDNAALETLFVTYRPRLRNVLCKKISKADDREDILQDICENVIKSIHKYNERSNFWSWVLGICNNKVYDYYRSSHRHHEITGQDLEALEQNGYQPLGSAILQPDEDFAKDEKKRIVKEALQAIAEPYRTTIKLFHLDEMSHTPQPS